MYPLTICRYSLPLLNPFESIYLVGLSVVFCYENIVHRVLGLQERLPFLPLMFTSTYCAIGVTYCWLSYYCYFLRINMQNHHTKTNKTNKTE